MCVDPVMEELKKMPALQVLDCNAGKPHGARRLGDVPRFRTNVIGQNTAVFRTLITHS